ncbi:MAG: DUF3868 domain-containing protein [Bacteroidales bacterium]|nr:DUF3868 domain-containing protein [Bacteroidales bacterium]
MSLRLHIVGFAVCAAATAMAASRGGCDAKISGAEVRDFYANRAGDRLAVSMQIVLDSLELKSEQQLILSPRLSADGDTMALPRIFINGRKQQLRYERGADKAPERGDIVERRRNGKQQTIDYSVLVPYQSWMDHMTAEISETDCGCGRQTPGPVVALQLPTAEVSYFPELAYIQPPAEPKEYNIHKTSYVTFPVDKIELYPTYMNNPAELDTIISTIRVVRDDPNVSITSISLHGYASPESPYDHNEYLTSNRSQTIKDYVQRMSNLADGLFHVTYTVEDWDGLKRFLNERGSEIVHADEILAICDDPKWADNPDAREWRIKSQYRAEYDYMLKNWYPYLRHTDYDISYTVRSFSIEEAKQILQTKPQQLSLNEMYLVAQTYAPGSDPFNEVMEIAVRLHPTDTSANLNAGCMRLEHDDYQRAKPYLDRAGTTAEAVNARGVVAYLEGDLTEARACWELASRMGLPEATRNLAELERRMKNE